MIASFALGKFIDDPEALNNRKVLGGNLFVKVEDCDLHGNHYVLLRTKFPTDLTDCLQLYRKARDELWHRICCYFVEPGVFQYDWEEIMDDAMVIVTKYTDRMAIFE